MSFIHPGLFYFAPLIRLDYVSAAKWLGREIVTICDLTPGKLFLTVLLFWFC